MDDLMPVMGKNSKIFLAGHKGLVGAAILRNLLSNGYCNIITRTHDELDLTAQIDVDRFFAEYRPEYVFLAAAKVGGILANNTYPADFIYSNTMIQTNVIHSSYVYHAKKLLFLGSACIYPRDCPQPIKEEYLLRGYLEKTNEPYAIAKISGIHMCRAYNKQYKTNFISVMPNNLYGVNDNFDLETSHVLPALIRKFSEAKMLMEKGESASVNIWGTGTPKREFLYVDDLADACVFLMNTYNDNEIINIGSGQEVSIKELALLIKKVVGYKGEIFFDPTKPDGTPRKFLDISRLNELGWKSRTGLLEGVKKTYQWYMENKTGSYRSNP